MRDYFDQWMPQFPVIAGLDPAIPFRWAHACLIEMAGTSPAMTVE